MTKHMTHDSMDVDTSAWTGWVLFASFMLGISGIYQMITGTVALFREEVFLVSEDQLVFLNFNQWGWTHVIIGAILFFAALALTTGKLWGRIVGVIVAILSASANFVFIQAYPLWSVMIILIDIAVIYAIIMHGSELREE